MSGRIKTSSAALPLLLDALGLWTSLEAAGFIGLPLVRGTVSVSFNKFPVVTDFPESIADLAQKYAQTTGHITTKGQQSRAYRVSRGKVRRVRNGRAH